MTTERPGQTTNNRNPQPTIGALGVCQMDSWVRITWRPWFTVNQMTAEKKLAKLALAMRMLDTQLTCLLRVFP